MCQLTFLSFFLSLFLSLWLASGPGGFSKGITGLGSDRGEGGQEKERRCGAASPGLWTLLLPELKPSPSGCATRGGYTAFVPLGLEPVPFTCC